MADDEFCPRCKEPLDYDEVDVGVGVIRGNYGCPNCFWNDQDEDCLRELTTTETDHATG